MPTINVHRDENGNLQTTPKEPIKGVFINLYDVKQLSTKHENGEIIHTVTLNDNTIATLKTTPSGEITFNAHRDDGNVTATLDNEYRLFIKQHN